MGLIDLIFRPSHLLLPFQFRSQSQSQDLPWLWFPTCVSPAGAERGSYDSRVRAIQELQVYNNRYRGNSKNNRP